MGNTLSGRKKQKLCSCREVWTKIVFIPTYSVFVKTYPNFIGWFLLNVERNMWTNRASQTSRRQIFTFQFLYRCSVLALDLWKSRNLFVFPFFGLPSKIITVEFRYSKKQRALPENRFIVSGDLSLLSVH